MKYILIIACFFCLKSTFASSILVPMDERQTNHLKAYGVSYWVLDNDLVMEWLLNYRGGSFLFPHLQAIEEELIVRGVSYEIISDGQSNAIRSQIGDPETNMEVVQLEKAPKIAVYTPSSSLPWDDAVTMVLGVALRYVRCREDANDVVQETFISMYTNYVQYDSSKPFSPWMKRIAINAALMYIRKNYKYKSFSCFC